VAGGQCVRNLWRQAGCNAPNCACNLRAGATSRECDRFCRCYDFVCPRRNSTARSKASAARPSAKAMAIRSLCSCGVGRRLAISTSRCERLRANSASFCREAISSEFALSTGKHDTPCPPACKLALLMQASRARPHRQEPALSMGNHGPPPLTPLFAPVIFSRHFLTLDFTALFRYSGFTIKSGCPRW